MKSKQWSATLLGLVVTSLLLGALASPSMAQGARVSRGPNGYLPGYGAFFGSSHYGSGFG
jgi:hypothetical protein